MTGHTQGYFPSLPHSDQFWGPPNFPLMGTRYFSAIGEVAEHEAAHSSLLISKVKNV
jgi:hypothetical protein